VHQRCQPCGFPRIWGLFFVDLNAFLKTCGLLGFAESCLFFADFVVRLCFFFKFYGTFAVSIYCKRNLGVSLHKFAQFGLVFPICLPVLVFSFPAVFLSISIFLLNAFWACFFD